MHHYLSVANMDAAELDGLLDLAATFKRDPAAAQLARAHAVALLFERPSLRTRTAYEVALMHLGGRAITVETQFGQRESIADVAQTLSYLVSAIVARVRDQASLELLATHASVPVINALSNREHPVEVLADALTLRELFGDLRGRRLAFLGEGNNICRSLMLLAPLIAMDIAVASPPGYEPDAEIVEQARSLAAKHGTQVQITANPQEAAEGAGVLYTDVWVSIGTEEDAEQRRQRFEPYQVNDDLLKLARPGTLVLHCLPARRGEEITASVLDGTRSFAFRRLANLVPVTTAVLYMLLK